MRTSYLVPLESSGDRAVCGGKAAGLATLLRHGFHVPPGVCLTTRAYLDTLHQVGLNPADMWSRVQQASPSIREHILEEHRGHIASLPFSRDILEHLESEVDRMSHAFRFAHESLWA